MRDGLESELDLCGVLLNGGVLGQDADGDRRVTEVIRIRLIDRVATLGPQRGADFGE